MLPVTAPAVGDRYWMVYAHGRAVRGREVEVSKIGRKWASLVDPDNPAREQGRFDIATGQYDNGGHGQGGALYASEQAWREHVRKQEAWRVFRNVARDAYMAPPHLTADDIEALTQTLTRTQEQI